MSRKTTFATALVMAAALVASGPARAHHVVWLDFAPFNVTNWPSIDLNGPAQLMDPVFGPYIAGVIADMIEVKMKRDWAPFDLYFTRVQPQIGSYSRVVFAADSNPSGVYGTVGQSKCNGWGCTGFGSWHEDESVLVVYTDALWEYGSAWEGGFNDGSDRIATTLANIASHELAHLLDLRHCNAYDDGQWDCLGTIAIAVSDQNTDWHLMQSHDGGLTQEALTLDKFFSIHSSRRKLINRLQVRNHWSPLRNNTTDPGSGVADLTYGRSTPNGALEQWFHRTGSAPTLGGWTDWGFHGTPPDLFMLGDVDGDTLADLVFGQIDPLTGAVAWSASLANGSYTAGFDPPVSWQTAGEAGEIFRLADVDADGDDDLIRGRALDSQTVQWWVSPSNGGFDPVGDLWSADAGERKDRFLVGDVTANGRADLVAVAGSSTEVYESFGSPSPGFVYRENDDFPGGYHPDYLMLGTADFDEGADLVTGNVGSNGLIDWKVFSSNRCTTNGCFHAPQTWLTNAGHAGDQARIGDVTAEGWVDLVYGRMTQMDDLDTTPDGHTMRWTLHLSYGSYFGSAMTWVPDAGNDGDQFP